MQDIYKQKMGTTYMLQKTIQKVRHQISRMGLLIL